MNQGIDFSSINLKSITPSLDQLLNPVFLEELHQSPKENDLVSILKCIDLTTLQGDDTPEVVTKLCKQAIQPVKGLDVQVAAVCIFPAFIPLARELLYNTDIKIATVAAGFPHGLSPLTSRIDEVSASADLGAHEIDIVIRRMYALNQQWSDLYDEIRTFKQKCKSAKLKVILATGELKHPEIIYKASMVSMMAGADFIKTSTGKEKVNATLEAGYVMACAIQDYCDLTSTKVGLKPAGGIRTSEEAFKWWNLTQKKLGHEWTTSQLFRIGASTLVDDIVQHLSAQETSIKH